MKLRNALLAATVMCAPAAAMAQPVTGPYIGLGLGFDYQQDVKLKSVTAAGMTGNIPGAEFESRGGIVGLGSVGFGYGNGLRAEIEGNFRGQHTHLSGNSAIGGGGEFQTYGVMVNGLYDFDAGLGWLFPYVGVGVGYEWTSINSGKVYTTNTTPQLVDNVSSDSKGSFAAQGILGASIPLTAIPGLSLTAEYRFLGSFSDNTYKGVGVAAGVPGSLPVSIKVGEQYHHAALLGLRYAFNAAPAAPPPAPAPVAAPAPAPARSYLVFFDWDKADLSARAKQIIAEAAQASTRVAVTRIEVSGHADRSGTPAYNQKLSLKRAQNVAAELVRLGVAQSAISIEAFGDTRPLVPTAAGVREPQNRRVEIVLK
jgi:OmpA-OmpF porin, OOP family